jgi:type VI protein secretion system component VasK
MFRSFLRFFGPRQLGLIGAFATYKLAPYMATSEENERINQKLKKKLNEKYHNRKDISFELTD